MNSLGLKSSIGFIILLYFVGGLALVPSELRVGRSEHKLPSSGSPLAVSLKQHNILALQSASLVNLTITTTLPNKPWANVTLKINNTMTVNFTGPGPVTVRLESGHNYTIAITHELAAPVQCGGLGYVFPLYDFANWNGTSSTNPLTLMINQDTILAANYTFGHADGAPTVQITSPLDQSVLSGVVNVTISYSTYFSSSLTLKIDGRNVSTTRLPSDTPASLQLDTRGLSRGKHTLEAYLVNGCSDEFHDITVFVGAKPLTPVDFLVIALTVAFVLLIRRRNDNNPVAQNKIWLRADSPSVFARRIFWLGRYYGDGG